jgi:uncharacterized protein (TIGR02466 family)
MKPIVMRPPLGDEPIEPRIEKNDSQIENEWTEPVVDSYREPHSDFKPAEGSIFDVFPTPMFRGYMDIDHDKVSQDVRDMVSKVKERNGDDVLRNYTTYFDTDIRESMYQLDWYTTFANVLKDTYIQFIHGEFNRRVNHLTRKDIHLFTWVNRYEGEHAHDVHNHINSTMSGTYYPLVNEHTSPIKFYNPNTLQGYATTDGSEPQEMNGITRVGGIDFHLQPILGEFLLWPSYMMHQVPQSGRGDSKNYERISISFNLSHNEPLLDTEQGDDLQYGFMHD